MALLKVFAEVEAKNGSSLPRIITVNVIELSSNKVIDLCLIVKHALSKVERGKVLISG